MGKRYYWIKLKEDFFSTKELKKMRRLAGGDTYTVIYLKMQLAAMRSGGVLRYTGLEDTVAAEIALDIDEEPQNVEMTLRFLAAHGLCEMRQNGDLYLPAVVENTGSEGASAQRVREHRERAKIQGYQDFAPLPPVTSALQCDAKTLHCNNSVTERKRKREEIEKDIEIDTEKDIFIADKPQRKKRFVPPTVEQVAEYVRARGSNVDPQYFVDFYASKGWMVGNHQMKDWKAACRNAERWESSKRQRVNIAEPKDYTYCEGSL